MSIKTLTVAAVAALGLSLGAYPASAGPVNGGAALSSAKAPSTFTLVRGGGGGFGGGGMGHGGGFGGGMGHGGGFGGGHMGGMAMGGRMGGMHYGGPGIGGRSFATPGFNRGFNGGRTAFYRPGIAGRGVYAGRVPGARMAIHNGHRGYWRHGRFFPFVGVGAGLGLWGWDYGYDGGGSCYTNCLAAGYGAAYCSANAYNFCY